MLHPDITYGIASERRKAMAEQAAAITRARAARRAARRSGRPAPALLSRVRVPLRSRTA
jgi:hypothetical protein